MPLPVSEPASPSSRWISAASARPAPSSTFLAADIEFHHLILEASGNDMFCALREVITEVLSGRTHQGLMPRTPRPHALDTHEQVAHAIRDGDAATAEAGMASLLAEVSSAIR
ncbi:FadR/GntR family transcriptional regulator [Clavibacter michiganensis]|uniref:FadR/GntR family transcriptional regulator n=1 Tax=Clavibacter michiganensis TaxID=28447 RepID=UPI000B576FBD|nr:FCD domain-containing protein [Clavibacter michiganensis]MDO4030878.1 FCD domain-containing protein [Clavibacter michiganensis]MDO4080286.1 FCD domain-containing protein [Clavibacter michiganensis]MDO4087660.1 FCD domain-containing protein [Clavibacter michiganensis]MDO4095714.1 FCD domain-containing protein [Clavibacter michiganensis]OUD95199.1 transcriptional regulator NanR [Clavibacter michiganensis subsp. michiganensis]